MPNPKEPPVQTPFIHPGNPTRQNPGQFGPGNPGRPAGAGDRKPRKRRPSAKALILEDFRKTHSAFLAALREVDPKAYLELLREQMPAPEWE